MIDASQPISPPSGEHSGAAGEVAVAPVVRLVGVRKTYRLGGRSVQALRGLDLSIDSPGFYAVMGRSGSGKSTMLHLLGGLDRPDAGEVHVGGRRIDRLEERALTLYRRREVGIVFQQFNLIPTLDALHNVMLPGVFDGRVAGELRPRAAVLLERLGLSGRASHRPDALSGGEQQRVAMARALLFRPALLLADEPTGNLDSASSEQIWSLLEELAHEESLTVVMVTHEPAAAVRCRSVHLLRDGVVAEKFELEGMDAGELAHRAERALGSTR